MIFRHIILKTRFLIMVPALLGLPLMALAEAANTDYIETVELKGVSVDEVFKFVSPESMFESVEMDASYDAFNQEYLAPQNTNETETEKFLKGLESNMKKMDPENLQAESVFETFKKYESQILTIVKKEKQLDELLDYIGRLKNVAIKRSPAPFSTLPKCNDDPRYAYQWPKVECS